MVPEKMGGGATQCNSIFCKIINKKTLYCVFIRYLRFSLFVASVWELFQAESIADEGTCGNSSVSSDATGVSDAVRRQLPVEAEGLENEYTYSSFVCVSGEWNDMWLFFFFKLMHRQQRVLFTF